ncbi:MAG: MFS transporter [Proteobacteria bacterium]|nr:MFS transporter [Pseudomonadota bacterium]
MIDLPSKQRSLAAPGFNRWLSLAAAAAIHMCIGQVYALSIFYGPLSHLVSGADSLFSDWTTARFGLVFTLSILSLGLTTCLAANWLYSVGPRAALFVAACFFGGGFFIASLGVATHQLWLVYVGYGVIGGIGLGLGYAAPIQTLLEWFPDRKGLATGLAITAFGAGGIVAVPLCTLLLEKFGTSTTLGVSETFLALGALYFLIMTVAAFAMRTPGPTRAMELASAANAGAPTVEVQLDLSSAQKTSQFYLIWIVLCVNVIAGISVLGSAPTVLMGMTNFSTGPASVAGFVGFLSLFNMAGRVLWGYASDYLGRKTSNALMLLLLILLYASVPIFGAIEHPAFFVLRCAVMVALYGGLFATTPSYIADIFGAHIAGRVHARMLTAWSAGAVGAFAVSWVGAQRIADGQSSFSVYAVTCSFIVGLLIVGFVCNALIFPLQPKARDAGGVRAGISKMFASDSFLPIVLGVSVIVALVVATSASITNAARYSLVAPISMTILPLLLGAGVCVAFHFLDRSRFAVRGVAGPYFAAIALLFSLYASLLATEIWQKMARTEVLMQAEVSSLQAVQRIATGVDGESRVVASAIESYEEAMAVRTKVGAPADGAADPMPTLLRSLYKVAADKEAFHGNNSANSAFYGALEGIRSSRAQRENLMSERVAPVKIISLMLFGFLTQLAIAFCHAGNRRAIGTTTMLFSVAFATAIAILELLDGSYLMTAGVTSLGALQR